MYIEIAKKTSFCYGRHFLRKKSVSNFGRNGLKKTYFSGEKNCKFIITNSPDKS